MDDENRQSIYPKIDDYEQSSETKGFYLSKSKYKEKLDKERVQILKNNLDSLDDKIKHYDKLLNKWKKINNILKYTNITRNHRHRRTLGANGARRNPASADRLGRSAAP